MVTGYLPSMEELSLMYQNKATIDATATANSGAAFTADDYWSSKEYNDMWARYLVFSNGGHGYNSKTMLYRIRAIRDF